jgi:hypothetical protein
VMVILGRKMLSLDSIIKKKPKFEKFEIKFLIA